MLQRLRATNLLPAHAGPSNVGARRAASAYVCIIECDGPNAMPTASLAALTALKVAAISDAHGTSQGRRDDDDTDEARCETRWALLEGVCTGGRASDRYADAVLLGVPSWIVDGPAPDTALAQSLAMPAAAPREATGASPPARALEDELIAQWQDRQWCHAHAATVANASTASGPPEAEARTCDNDHESATSGGGRVEVAAASSTPGVLLLPALASETRAVKQPASLLQKAIRRRAGALSSSLPVLESCMALLAPAAADGTSKPAPRGGTAAMLTAVWGGMLADSQPFEAPEDGSALGIEQLLALTLVARADPSWALPAQLRSKAVASALRTQAREANQWIGFVRTKRDEQQIFDLEHDGQLGARVRNMLRALHASAPFSFCFGAWDHFEGDRVSGAVWAHLSSEYTSWLRPERLRSEPVPNERVLLDAWVAGRPPAPVDARMQKLDAQTRLASYDLNVSPSALLLLQALLPSPPDSRKRSSLQSLSRHFRKLSSEVNPRDQQRQLLARIEMLRTSNAAAIDSAGGSGPSSMATVKSTAEAEAEAKASRAFTSDVDLFEGLSPKERELLERVRVVQAYLQGCPASPSVPASVAESSAIAGCAFAEDGKNGKTLVVAYSAARVRESAGGELSEHDGRRGFLLAFGAVFELQVTGAAGKEEMVGVFFGGTPDAPLLVQRIGQAHEEAAATSAGTSGAVAVPQLGYVTKRVAEDLNDWEQERAKADGVLYDAAVKAAAAHWKGGKRRALAVPPRGLQWELGAPRGSEEAAEAEVSLAADLDAKTGKWSFSIAGKPVLPLDARAVLSPCSEPSEVVPLVEGSQRQLLIRRALYSFPHERTEGNEPWAKADGGELVATQLGLVNELHLFERLHAMAVASRSAGAREGLVYEWSALAASGAITCGTWRDALLAITTRDADHITLGPVRADGSGTGRDMTEGVLYRILHVLESLYPATLLKESALKWRLIPRGAAYHHLLQMLEQLGRGSVLQSRSPDSRTAAAGAGSSNQLVSPATAGKSSGAVAVGLEQHSGEVTAEATTASGSKRAKRKAGVAAQSAAAEAAAAEASPSRVRGADDANEAPRIRTGFSVGDGSAAAMEVLELPKIVSKLWDHQKRSVAAILAGLRAGKLGFADASTVGAGKTLTALATIVEIASFLETKDQPRHGVLVMVPEPNLIKEWLLELAKHTSGFHVVEQRETGELFSNTYGKSHAPIDASTIVLSSLDRVAAHPFMRQTCWDFVVIDECLAVQNANAKRCPSAWRQIEVSTCGVLMLSATFFRSKFSSLFYMIRMLRSPLPRTLEFLPALIHEHIVCEVPETDRSWHMHGEAVPLEDADMQQYRGIINRHERTRLNYGVANGLALFGELRSFLSGPAWEARTGSHAAHATTSPLGEAFAQQALKLLQPSKERPWRCRPLIFANTEEEKTHLVAVLRAHGIEATTWKEVQQARLRGGQAPKGNSSRLVIVANKQTEGEGSNMQADADAIICRPTAGDRLEQMKGRVDRPGQTTKRLILVVIYAANTVEEAEFANIQLAGNFFRQYIAPIARRYREYKDAVDLEAIRAAGGDKRLKKGAVQEAWHKCLEITSGNLAAAPADGDDSVGGGGVDGDGYVNGKGGVSSTGNVDDHDDASGDDGDLTLEELLGEDEDGEEPAPRRMSSSQRSRGARVPMKLKMGAEAEVGDEEEHIEFVPVNTTKRNRGDPMVVRAAKQAAREGKASATVREWLLAPREKTARSKPRKAFAEFSDTTPPLVLDGPTIEKAIAHLSQCDPKIESLIARVGKEALCDNIGVVLPPTRERFFDKLLKGITFCQISVKSGETMLRKLAIKCGVLLEAKPVAERQAKLRAILGELRNSGECGPTQLADEAELLKVLLEGDFRRFVFTPLMVDVVGSACNSMGLPHLAGSGSGNFVKVKAGQNDDPANFRDVCRAQEADPKNAKTACGFSAGTPGKVNGKAPFILQLVRKFKNGEVPDVATLSDREAAKMLRGFQGVGDWVAGRVLMDFLQRADIMLYGDLTIRNYLNDLYNIDHVSTSETMIESAADFPDTPQVRNLIDGVAERHGWAPYRSIICILMYFLQEDNLVLL